MLAVIMTKLHAIMRQKLQGNSLFKKQKLQKLILRCLQWLIQPIFTCLRSTIEKTTIRTSSHVTRRRDGFIFNFKQVWYIVLVFHYSLWTCKWRLRTYFTFPQMHNFILKDFFSKWGHIRSFLRIWSHLLKKSYNWKT